MAKARERLDAAHALQVLLRITVGGRRREFAFGAQSLRRLRIGVAMIGMAQLVALGTIIALWRPAMSTSHLVEENLALRSQLVDIQTKVDDAAFMLERLRLYDAELRSLSAARGASGGPIAPLYMSNERIMEWGVPQDKLAPEGDMPVVQARDEPSVSQVNDVADPAHTWALAIRDRLDDLVDTFRLSERDLSMLMADLETLHAVQASLPSRWPADGTLTSGFGWRRDPMRRTLRFHAGLDIANQRGTPIFAVAPGVVTESTYGGGYGNYVEIDHGFGIRTRYGHMSRRAVEFGAIVDRGTYLGAMGSTGRSTGSHVHFEIRIDGSAHDPLTYLPR